MRLADLTDGEHIFLDANLLVYHFAAHPQLGQACTDFVERITRNEITGFTSTHVLSEAAHRLMTYEASRKFGWTSKIVDRLKQQPGEIQKLSDFRDAIDEVPRLGIQVVTIPVDLVATAASISIQYGLLSNDALTVAVMQQRGLTNIASHDADFDRVPGLTRYAPA
jgi:predicted nucleic acid-binding protein